MTDKERQKKATEIAAETGFSLALYVGEKDGKNVYLLGDKEPRKTGLPCFVVFDENDKDDMVFGFDYMDLVEQYVKRNEQKL